jgi:sensor histidine kinase YesM
MKKNDRLIRRGWRGWLTLYGIWTVPGLLMASGYYYVQCGLSSAPAPLLPIFLDYLWFFYLFASVCPLTYYLTGRYRFTPSSWYKALAVHLLTAFVLLEGILVVWGVMKVYMMNSQFTVLESVAMQLTKPQAIVRGIMSLAYYVMVVGAMVMIRWNRQRKQQEARTRELELRASRLESQLNTARLETLKMQLRPHFFFNALNTISALVENKQNDLAFKTIAQLGDLLRTSLKLPDTTAIPLRDELAFIEKYLSIERIRFSDRLKTRLDAPGEYLDVMVPALILQPLVENCIHHAAAVQVEPLTVSIRVSKEGESLVLEVKDDGPGLPAGWNMDSHAGVGLGNLRQRLQVMYGDGHGLTTLSPPSGGVTARVTLPFPVSAAVPPGAFKESENTGNGEINHSNRLEAAGTISHEHRLEDSNPDR